MLGIGDRHPPLFYKLRIRVAVGLNEVSTESHEERDARSGPVLSTTARRDDPACGAFALLDAREAMPTEKMLCPPHTHGTYSLLGTSWSHQGRERVELRILCISATDLPQRSSLGEYFDVRNSSGRLECMPVGTSRLPSSACAEGQVSALAAHRKQDSLSRS